MNDGDVFALQTATLAAEPSGDFQDEVSLETALYVGGFFTHAGCQPAGKIASWVCREVEAISASQLGGLTGDNTIEIHDLRILFEQWGPCSDHIDCPADLNNDVVADALHVLTLIDNWG